MTLGAVDFRPALFTVGILLLVIAAGMTVPAIVDLATHDAEWQAFLASAGITAFAGGGLALTTRAEFHGFTVRQAFMVVVLAWVVLTLFAALPFMLSSLQLSFTDAYFEAMSGITTTGSTVLTGLDHLPAGILLWRAVLQWLGGLGIIVMALSILPSLRIGGMQMFRVEAFETEGKALPRAAAISGGITVILIVFTAALVLSLKAAGLSWLEATVHAMTTIATGGYSTADASVGHFDSATVDAIITLGMIVGGIPFLLFLKTLRGDRRSLVKDEQVRWYLSLLALSSLAVASWLWLTGQMAPLPALRFASFNVVSIMTGTGYASADYTAWGAFPVGLIFFLMFVGGCYGSTACGIKVFRFQVLYAAAKAQIGRLVEPHGVFVPTFNGNPITDEVVNSVLGYFFMFGVFFAALTMALCTQGLDLVSAMSGAGTAMSNVGPGLGPIIGPAGNFQGLSDVSKWLLVSGMLVGRLEVFTVFVLFSRRFWRA